MKIMVVGSGGWGTALALSLLKEGHSVLLWSFRREESEYLALCRENPYLKGIALPDGLSYTYDAADAVGQEMLVFVTPSFAVRSTAKLFAPYLSENAILVSATKGIETDSGLRMTQIIEAETGKKVVALSGPSHAEEVGRGIPTGVVAACEDKELAEKVQLAFMGEHLRVYTCPDAIGVELGAAHKNVIALCAGICDGMGFGDNTKALLMTRGLAEVARLGMALGAKRETFAGLAGIGDLIVTCTSMHSRNRRAGILIGQGKTPADAMEEVGAVVEGYYAAAAAYRLAEQYDVDMPITKAAYKVLYEGADPAVALERLMQRGKTAEADYAQWVR